MNGPPKIEIPPLMKCKCGTEIFFVRSPKTGKQSPLNATKRLFATLEKSESGDTVVKEWRWGFESHFATCPFRDEFRKEDV